MTNPLISDAVFSLEIQIHDAFRQASAAGIAKASDHMFASMLGSIENSVISKTTFTKAHKRIAAEMKSSVLHSYDQRVTAREEFAPYRIGRNRLSGGVLKRALRGAGMFVADGTSIGFINEGTMDSEAAHWRRLNFGAGGAAFDLYKGQQFVVQFGKTRLGKIGSTQEPSGDVLMPQGYWSKGGKQLPGFYPTGQVADRMTKGIPGRRFLDAGLKAFARELPIAYEDLLVQFKDKAVKTAATGSGTAGTGSSRAGSVAPPGGTQVTGKGSRWKIKVKSLFTKFRRR